MPPEGSPAAAAAVTVAPPRVDTFFGAIDRIYDHRVTGWAWDRALPTEQLEIEIIVDATTVARGSANRLREDLANNGVGDGRHAFDIAVDQPLPVDAKHRVAAVAIDQKGGRRLTLLNREAPAPAATVPVPPPVLDAPGPVVPTGVPEALGRWLDDFRIVQASLETALVSAVKQVRSSSNQRLVEMTNDSKRVGEALQSLQAAQEQFAQQLETMTAVQARIDQALVSIRSAEAERPRRDAVESWTRRVVALLAVISVTALACGVYSLVG